MLFSMNQFIWSVLKVWSRSLRVFQAEHFKMGQLLTLISKLILPISPFHALYGFHLP